MHKSELEQKERTTVAVTPELHGVIKIYARRRGMMIESAVDKLVRLALTLEMGKK